MAVIAVPQIPPQGASVTDDWELRSITARYMSPLNGVATTLERPGAHWAVTPRFHNLNGANRAKMQTFAQACRGHASRFYLPLFGWTRRGSFAAPELFTNNTFASGTSNWTAQSSTLTASDGILRINGTSVGANPGAYQSFAMTQYAPYALRGLLLNSGFPYTAPAVYLTDVTFNTVQPSGFGLKTAVLVAETTTGTGFCGYISDATGYLTSHYLEVGYSSVARCALVDNGPNFTQRSDEIDNAYWSKSNVTISANAGTSPDGTATMDTMVESVAASVQHYFSRGETRTSQAEDWCIFGYFRRASGTRNINLLIGRDFSNMASAIFDLNAGTVGSVALSGDTTNGRAFIRDAGSGAYYCAVVARLTATTAVQTMFQLISGASTTVYTGDGASGVHCWRCGAAQSSVPTRGMQTTSAGDSDGTLQTGSALYLKGLPASTNGLLLQGDPVEIITNTSSQLVRVRAPLNSDAAGLGYLQFEAPLRISPLDNAAVIVCNPLCRMMLDDNTVRWSEHDGTFTDLEFTAVEDTYP